MAQTISSTVNVRLLAMDIASYLQAVSEKLTADRFTAAGLATLDFNPDDSIKVGILERPRLGFYPTLEAILDEIGATCWAEGMTLCQLRRLEFSDDAIVLELNGDQGRTPPRYCFPIDVFARDN